jgi:NAD dependent epimerase/dehydratase
MTLPSDPVLVTGAAGFLGSHLCERLARDGLQVRAFCRYTSRRELGNLADLPEDIRGALDIRFGNLADGDFVRRVMDGCAAVFHLGASISVPYSYEAPREVVITNVEGTLNVLSAAREVQPASLVHVSSSEVYGTAQYVPMDESHPLHAQSPYAASKVGADKLAETFHLSFDMPVVIARPFNTFGPRQSGRAVIGTIIRQALAGGELRLGKVTPTRDFVFVTDTVDALVRLGGFAGHGETFNIASGVDTSIERVAEMVGVLIGRELRILSEEERLRPEASEVERLLGDATKLREATGWAPAYDLAAGLEATIEWASTQRPDVLALRGYEV